MRLLAPIVPLLLLACLFGYSWRSSRVEDLAEAAVQVEPSAPADGILWISHDWVEVAPAETPTSRAETRRATFGLNAERDAAECTDPNCRACLVDLVYGREF